MAEEKQKTIIDIIEEVQNEICDNYCMYPGMYYAGNEDELYEHCMKCPLNKLI